MAEFLPGFEITSWGGVWARPACRRRWSSGIGALTRQAVQSPEVAARYADNGATVWPIDGEELARFRAANEQVFAPIIRASGAQVD